MFFRFIIKVTIRNWVEYVTYMGGRRIHRVFWLENLIRRDKVGNMQILSMTG